MTSPWIITEQGDPMNLAFVAKIMWGGDFPSPYDAQKKQIYICHGGVAQTSGSKNATTCYKYPDAIRAKAARDRLANVILALTATQDLRTTPLTLTSLTPASVPAGNEFAVTLNGTNLTPGVVIISGLTLPVTDAGAGLGFTTDRTIAAGTYDVLYVSAEGLVAELANGLTFT
jgi:hypothetical protein